MNKLKNSKYYYLYKELVSRYFRHNISQIGGQLAYFSILSLFPFVIYMNALISAMHLSVESVIGLLTPFFTKEIIDFIRSYVDSVAGANSAMFLTAGIFATVYSLSKIIRSLDIAFNRAYSISVKRGFIKSILTSLLFIICSGISLILVAILAVFGKTIINIILKILHLSTAYTSTILLLKWVGVLFLLFILMFVLYYFIPNKKMRIKQAIPGAFFSVLGFSLLSYFFGLYVKYMAVNSVVYGSIGAVFLILIWAYFAGIILVLGAEINCAIENYKSGAVSKEN